MIVATGACLAFSLFAQSLVPQPHAIHAPKTATKLAALRMQQPPELERTPITYDEYMRQRSSGRVFSGVVQPTAGKEVSQAPSPVTKARAQFMQMGNKFMGEPNKRTDAELDNYADYLFNFYGDGTGSVKREEFNAIAGFIKQKGDRRKALQLVSAVAGSLLVSQYSNEYQALQKAFRPLYVEPRADASQAKIFPTALLSSDVDSIVASTLASRGFTPANTLFAHSVCSDEVNSKDEQLMPLMMNRWGEGFSLGGLAGLPFAGKSGFRAYLHHVPDNGKLLIMFAPHVGIDGDGRIGALQRSGQDAVSKACGAAIGAFKAIGKQKAARTAEGGNVLAIADRGENEEFDPQIQQIVKLLEPKLEGVDQSANDIGFVTYQMYGVVRDLVSACVSQTPDVWEWTNEVALVGGIIINRKNGGDFFQPLSFETRTQDAAPTDLYEEAFGKRPDLQPILGSNTVTQEVYGRETLSTLSSAIRASLPAL